MPKNQTIMQKFRDYSPYILWLVGVFTIFANLWVASRLAPISERVSLNTITVQAAIDDVNEIKLDYKELVNKDDLMQLDKRLDKIENKVDTLLLR